jgi:hypothetical protein
MFGSTEVLFSKVLKKNEVQMYPIQNNNFNPGLALIQLWTTTPLVNWSASSLTLPIPEPTARSAVPGVNPGRGY